MTFAPPRPATPTRPTAARRRPPAGNKLVADAAALAVGLGLGASIAVPLSQATSSSLKAPGGVAILLGDVTAMAGTYLLLVMVLLAGRIPAVERALGQDRMIRWHRLLSPAPLVLLSAHAYFTIGGFGIAAGSGVGFWSEAWTLITTMGWIFASVVAYLMFMGIAAVSIRAVRRRFSYDTWWVIHLYTYLALAFSVPHQIFSGTNFVGHPGVQAAWMLLWLGTAGVVVVFRLGLPVARSLYHRFELVSVQDEGPGVYSLVIRGRHMEQLAVSGGQYFGWRFLVRGMWWHAHPFSISAVPRAPFMRVTIKVAGDATAQIARLRPGTRIALEGPYGTFTDDSRTRHKVALIGAGVGITPLRALLEDVPRDVDVVVVQRASRPDELIHHKELDAMVSSRGGRLVELVGSRRQHRLDDPYQLARVVPDLAQRDVYVCGPDAFSLGVVGAARSLGVDEAAIHCESFEF